MTTELLTYDRFLVVLKKEILFVGKYVDDQYRILANKLKLANASEEIWNKTAFILYTRNALCDYPKHKEFIEATNIAWLLDAKTTPSNVEMFKKVCKLINEYLK